MKTVFGDDMTGDDFDLAQAIKSNARGIQDLTRLLGLVAVLSFVVGGLVAYGGWLVIEDQAERRRENCVHVADSFDAYTDALAEISGAPSERVQRFRDAYEPRLTKCD